MPIYEYHCEKCGEFDVMQKITAKPLRKCPTCKSKVKKLMSNTAFQLKGTGWYVTDYAGKGKGGSEAKESKESKSTDTSSSDSSSTKTEKKSSKKSKGESAAA